jgi:hypothetical protein
MSLKKQLLDIVSLRDNIGEAFWYIYTALLLIFIVQYNIVSRPCNKDPAALAASHSQFLEEEQKNIEENDNLNSQTYIG